jgi:HEAT repeat protein
VAYDLNSRLVRDPAAREDARLVPELLAAFREMTPPRDQDEAMTRTYIVTILGILRKPEGLPVVIEAMTDRDGACQVAGIQAAGAIGDPAVVPQLVEFAGADDAGLRKAGVFALGLFSPRRREAEKLPALSKESHDAARAAIFKAHRDRVEDVRWNAALALARWGEGEAAGTLKTMLDRKHLENVGAEEATKMTEEMTVEVMVNAMKGALELKDESFRPLLEELRKGDRSMAVRQAAGTVLEAMGGRSS